MDLAKAKLTEMAREDGVSTDKFLEFARTVYDKVIAHSPNGIFYVLLPKNHHHPLGVSIAYPSDADLSNLLYQLRDCAAGKPVITVCAEGGTRPTVLQIKTK